MIPQALSQAELTDFALEGEALASGSKHADNIAPCLYGGLTLSDPGANPDVRSFPYPKSLICILVHPDLRVDTALARSVLKPDLLLKTHIQQSAKLASFLVGCMSSDISLIKKGLEDLVIEPQRQRLIPGFTEVKKAAIESGVLGCSISGAGPAVFALTDDSQVAEVAKNAMIQAFLKAGLASTGYISPIRVEGASVDSTVDLTAGSSV